jgi:hypothetical protein
MGYVTFSIPHEIVKSFKTAGNIVNFIETGTYKGETCFWASQHFENVYTIEIDPEISLETSLRLDCPSNINFFVGDSKYELEKVLDIVEGRSLYWLDGHWCSTSTLGMDTECPLLDELKAISRKQNDIILIDDARLFLGPPLPPHKKYLWPKIDEIIIYLKSMPMSYLILQALNLVQFSKCFLNLNIFFILVN